MLGRRCPERFGFQFPQMHSPAPSYMNSCHFCTELPSWLVVLHTGASSCLCPLNG